MRRFVKVSRQGIFIGWRRCVGGNDIFISAGLCHPFFLENAASYQFVPWSAVRAGFFVYVGVGRAFGNLYRSISPHEGLIIAAASTRCSEHLIKGASIPVRGIVFKDTHDVIKVLPLFKVTAPPGSHD